MARPLRVDVEGGWYHVTMRGQRRGEIVVENGDRKRWLELVSELPERYGVEIHAYVLMDNHYHLVVRTPEANLSRAMQWLNVSYGVWWNLKHGESGHVFQGRFKAILVEGGGWVLRLSEYVHLNPVALKNLGWSKRQKELESEGLVRPSAEVVAKRLETMRTYRWSSYRGYAGYEPIPKWLSSREILARVKGGREGYREQVEQKLKAGHGESIWSQVKWSAILGSAEFCEKWKPRLKVSRESVGRSEVVRGRGWADVVKVVEAVKGEAWETFCDRHGDWGRDMAFWLARRSTTLTLQQLGEKVGGMDYAAVGAACRKFENVQMRRPPVLASLKIACKKLKVTT